jgi:hypothetical protein
MFFLTSFTRPGMDLSRLPRIRSVTGGNAVAWLALAAISWTGAPAIS